MFSAKLQGKIKLLHSTLRVIEDFQANVISVVDLDIRPQSAEVANRIGKKGVLAMLIDQVSPIIRMHSPVAHSVENATNVTNGAIRLNSVNPTLFMLLK